MFIIIGTIYFIQATNKLHHLGGEKYNNMIITRCFGLRVKFINQLRIHFERILTRFDSIY